MSSQCIAPSSFRARMMELAYEYELLFGELERTALSTNQVKLWAIGNAVGFSEGARALPFIEPKRRNIVDLDADPESVINGETGQSEKTMVNGETRETAEEEGDKFSLSMRNKFRQKTSASIVTLPDGVGKHESDFLGNDFLEATSKGDIDEIRRLVESTADVNEVFYKFSCSNKEILSGSALAVAGLRGNREAMRCLLEIRASPDIKYSCVVGRNHTEVSFSVAHAVVSRGADDMLKLLAEFSADLGATTSLGGTLLWEAAHSGKSTQVVQYLLNEGVDKDAAARHQDDFSQLHTPLHVASLQGHAKVVGLLLNAQCCTAGANVNGASPLRDAISKGHGRVVGKLVAKGASLFDSRTADIKEVGKSRRPSISYDMRSCLESDRSIDHLFYFANDAVIASAALGLQTVHPTELERLTPHDCARFLGTPGDAPMFFLQSIVRPHQIRYWDEKKQRHLVSTALVPLKRNFNVAVGPHPDELSRLFNKKVAPNQITSKFIEDLAPRHTKTRAGFAFVPGSLSMCHVAGIGDSPEVLHALTQCDASIFTVPLIQGILTIQWRKARLAQLSLSFWELFYVTTICIVNSAFANVSLDTLKSPEFTPLLILAMVMWSVEVLLKLMQAVGFMVYGACPSVYEQLVSFEVLLSGLLLMSFILFPDEAKEYKQFNVALGIIVCLRWSKVTYSLRGVEAIGLRVLPIMATFKEVGPFCAVLLSFLLGATNMYYALALHSLDNSFNIIFRIVFLGDLDPRELENSPEWGYSEGDGGPIYQIAPKETDYHYVVELFLYLIAFILGTTLMNIFIAVLSKCYYEASDNSMSIFLAARANIALKDHIMKAGLSTIRRRLVGFDMPIVAKKSTAKEEVVMPEEYVWLFRASEHTADDEDDDICEPPLPLLQYGHRGSNPSARNHLSARR